jgi:hypothetical protein
VPCLPATIGRPLAPCLYIAKNKAQSNKLRQSTQQHVETKWEIQRVGLPLGGKSLFVSLLSCQGMKGVSIPFLSSGVLPKGKLKKTSRLPTCPSFQPPPPPIPFHPIPARRLPSPFPHSALKPSSLTALLAATTRFSSRFVRMGVSALGFTFPSTTSREYWARCVRVYGGGGGGGGIVGW